MTPQVHIFSILEEHNSYVPRSLVLYKDNKCGYSDLFDNFKQ